MATTKKKKPAVRKSKVEEKFIIFDIDGNRDDSLVYLDANCSKGAGNREQAQEYLDENASDLTNIRVFKVVEVPYKVIPGVPAVSAKVIF